MNSTFVKVRAFKGWPIKDHLQLIHKENKKDKCCKFGACDKQTRDNQKAKIKYKYGCLCRSFITIYFSLR